MDTFREILALELMKRMKSRGLTSKALIVGKITAEVFGPDGRLKQSSVMHNLVVDQGDALIADCLAMTPARTKLDNTHAWIEVGTGYSSAVKSIAAVVTVTGVPRIMDATYPKTKGAWGAASDNVITYKATFAAGLLNVTGINEAALVNSATHAVGDCMAYGQITPSVNVGLLDTLAVTWEISILGA